MNYELIKVCGMRDADNIRAVEALGIDWLGLIFAPKSSRYVAERPAYLPTRCKRVGVFVNASLEEVTEHIAAFGLDLVQLHGSESPAYIADLRQATSVSVIKVFSIATADDLVQTQAYEGLVDYFLFDTKGQLAGGNGTQFDWSVLSEYRGNTPFLLSGGIGPDDAARVSAFDHPKCIGIDLNSRFETAPALKDITLLKSFLEQINKKEHE